ncbi:hypothetical protein IV203_017548 [Nitzschia inconspicua]|uniref:Uncharacterized protein n=1 Tax=Nitzschia inconspicua TaxID=303405 RepID=A0A9K3K4I5_9STRA|nr:hypothetical protein IV203_017548 [Nitzschia inconspicua]
MPHQRNDWTFDENAEDEKDTAQNLNRRKVRKLPTSEDCRNVVTSDITTVEVCPDRLREHGISHAIVTSCSLFTPGQAVYVSPLFITAKKSSLLSQNKESGRGAHSKIWGRHFCSFDSNSVAEFEAGNETMKSNLNNDYFCTIPHINKRGLIISCSDHDTQSHFPIEQYLEMRSLPNSPRRLIFIVSSVPSYNTSFNKSQTYLGKISQAISLIYTRTHNIKGANPVFNNVISDMKR